MRLNLINGNHANELDSGHRMVAFGDGLFETCFVDQGRIRFWSDHLARLEHGLSRLQMAWSALDRQLLEAEIGLALAGLEGPAVCKLLLGRGVKGRGYDFDPDTQNTDRIIQVFDYQPPSWLSTGADLVKATVPVSVNPALAGVKHLNRLDSVLARQSARHAGAHEALMAMPDGRLVEGSMSNVLILRDGQWSTPPLDLAGVNGIVRRRLLQQDMLAVVERDCHMDELAGVESMLICNSLIGIVPVRSFERCPVPPPDERELHQLYLAIGLSRD